MKSLEYKAPPAFNLQSSLEHIKDVSDVQKVELNSEYFDWAKVNVAPELYELIKNNFASVDAYRYKYISDGLSVAGFMWAPKEIKEQLPMVVWNRGGSGKLGSIGKKSGMIFGDMPCEFAKDGAIVVASEYRGGFDSEGSDEWGGGDVEDVINLKKIADQLPMVKSGKAVVSGFSRGGMMSYLLASKEPWVKAVIAISGTADLIADAKERPDMDEVFSEAFGGSDEERKKRSATYFYEQIPKDLPILILHGTADKRVSISQARKLHELLETSGHTVEYHEFRGGEHDFNSPETLQGKETLEIVKTFLKDQL